MSTQFSDIKYDPDVYASYLAEKSVILNALAAADVVVESEDLNARANGPSAITTIPSWNPLDASSEPNYGTDDPADVATPGKITAEEQKARTAYLNNGWKAADLIVEFSRNDPMAAIAARTNEYWQTQFQKRLIQMLLGVIADNEANDSGDMVQDIAIEDGDSAVAANLFSADAFLDAAFTLGDHWENTTAIAVHSKVMRRMAGQGLIEYIRDADNNVNFASYMGRRVIVDDGLPVSAGGTSGSKYTSVLFGRGAIGFGTGSPRVPTEISRNADEGNGAGMETLWERQTWLMHPLGFHFTSSSVAGVSPTWANLANAANWDRVYDRKNIPLAFLKTNG